MMSDPMHDSGIQYHQCWFWLSHGRGRTRLYADERAVCTQKHRPLNKFVDHSSQSTIRCSAPTGKWPACDVSSSHGRISDMNSIEFASEREPNWTNRSWEGSRSVTSVRTRLMESGIRHSGWMERMSRIMPWVRGKP